MKTPTLLSFLLFGCSTPAFVQVLEPEATNSYVRVDQGLTADLRTSKVVSGGTTLSNAVHSTRQDDDGRLELGRLEFVEVFTPSNEGVEQSWLFAKGPDAGPIEVEVELDRARELRFTDEGIEVELPKRLVLYKHGVWIDADGRRTAVPAKVRGGKISLSVSPETVGQSKFPAVLDPQIIITPGLN